MEPTDARKAYPCFDEPAFKIRYTTTLVHEQGHVALSNMNVSRVKIFFFIQFQQYLLMVQTYTAYSVEHYTEISQK